MQPAIALTWPLRIALLLLLGAGPCRADPELLFNGGWGFFKNSDNAVELSQWAHVPFMDGLFHLWHGTNAWFGASEGWYLDSGNRSHYFEFQTRLYDSDGIPIGLSIGPSFNRHQPYHIRGSAWASIWNVVFSVGFEENPSRDRYSPFAGVFVKIPVWLGSHL